LPAVGFRTGDAALNQPGSRGIYWSSSARDGTSRFRLAFSANSTPDEHGSPADGMTIRCVRYEIRCMGNFFLPAGGGRIPADGTPNNGLGSQGKYWAAVQLNSSLGGSLVYFTSVSHPNRDDVAKAFGVNVRCVRYEIKEQL